MGHGTLPGEGWVPPFSPIAVSKGWELKLLLPVTIGQSWAEALGGLVWGSVHVPAAAQASVGVGWISAAEQAAGQGWSPSSLPTLRDSACSAAPWGLGCPSSAGLSVSCSTLGLGMSQLSGTQRVLLHPGAWDALQDGDALGLVVSCGVAALRDSWCPMGRWHPGAGGPCGQQGLAQVIKPKKTSRWKGTHQDRQGQLLGHYSPCLIAVCSGFATAKQSRGVAPVRHIGTVRCRGSSPGQLGPTPSGHGRSRGSAWPRSSS